MNVDFKVSATLARCTLRTKQKDDLVTRIVRLVLKRDFDDEIAAVFGKDAQAQLALLKGSSISETKIPIDAITAKMHLKSGSAGEVTIPIVAGVFAKGKAGKIATEKRDATNATIELHFEFIMLRKAWAFIGDHHNAWIDVEVQSVQGELDLAYPVTASAKPPEEKKGKKSKPRKGGKAAKAHVEEGDDDDEEDEDEDESGVPSDVSGQPGNEGLAF